MERDDLVVIDFNNEGADWIHDAKNKQHAARFLRASLKARFGGRSE